MTLFAALLMTSNDAEHFVFHVPTGYFNVLYCEVSVQGFPYFNWIVGYFIYFYVVEALYTQTGMCSHAHTKVNM